MQSTTPVLQSTDPALLCTTKYHSMRQSITPVLQSTTPALLCTTPYYKVLLQYQSATKYHSVPASLAVRGATGVIYHCPTLPNTVPATKTDSHDYESLSHLKRHLQCVGQEISTTNLTKYCACHEKSISWLIPLPSMTRPWSEHDPTMTRHVIGKI